MYDSSAFSVLTAKKKDLDELEVISILLNIAFWTVGYVYTASLNILTFHRET